MFDVLIPSFDEVALQFDGTLLELMKFVCKSTFNPLRMMADWRSCVTDHKLPNRLSVRSKLSTLV